MNHPAPVRFRSLLTVFRENWKTLALTHIAYKIIQFVLLVPVVALLFRGFVAFSGRAVLADQDILTFFLSPIGWLALLVIGAVSIAILALEQTALAAVLFFRTAAHRLTVRQALIFAGQKTWPVLQVTARMVGWSLLAAVPFLIAAGGVYLFFLTDYDINFYLTKRPPAFVAAVALGGVLGTGLLLVLVWLVSGWVYALPLLLFENSRPAAALSTSRQLATGDQVRIVRIIIKWGVTMALISFVLGGVAGGIGTVLIAAAGESLTPVLLAAGAALLLASAGNFVANLLAATTFAVLFVELYRALSRDAQAASHVDAVVDTAAGHLLLKVTRSRLAILAAIALLAAGSIGVGLLQSVSTEDHTAITGHRGASGAAPENTLASIQRAIDEGADYAEIDVQETRDGVVVVVHDSDLKKLGGPGTKIWDATAEELRQVDIGSWFDPQFSDQRVPTLAEVLSLCQGKIRVNIELKSYGHNDRLEERVAKIVEEHGMQNEIIVMSLDQAMVARMKSLRPEWTVGLLTAVAAGDLTRLDADFLAVNLKIANRRFVQTAHGRDKQVFAWTVNDPLIMSTLIGRGVDNLITDKPALARSVLRQREEMSSVERLLVELGGTWSDAVDPDEEPITQ